MTKTTAKRASATASAAKKAGKAVAAPARKTPTKTPARPAPKAKAAPTAKTAASAKRASPAKSAAPRTPPGKPAAPKRPAPAADTRPPVRKPAAPAVAAKPVRKPAPAATVPASPVAVPTAAPAPALAPALAPAPAPAPTRMTSSAKSKASAKAQAAYAAPAPMPVPTSRFADRFAPPRPPTRQMNHLEADRERQPLKHDPKLVNAWKNKAGRDLSEAELLAMPQSEYMNEKQLDYFRATLQRQKDDLLSNAGQTTENLREDTSIVPDPADRATIEEEHALELRTRDRERKLMKKIAQSLARIDSGDYGFCDETGEPIGLGRLLARPTATLSLEAQQRRELKQKMFGD